MPQAILSALPRDVPCLRVPAVTLENVSTKLKIEKGWLGIKMNKRIKIKEKKTRSLEPQKASNPETRKPSEQPKRSRPKAAPGPGLVGNTEIFET